MSSRILGCCVRAGLGALMLLAFTRPSAGLLYLGPEELVQASGASIDVGDYSVPSSVDWDNDGLADLVIGEKTPAGTGKVRIYLNVGSAGAPQFSTDPGKCFYAKANGSDLTVSGAACMGCWPRVVQWDGDGKKDLLVGDAVGYVYLFQNINTDGAPLFNGGTRLKVGEPGAKVDIYVGPRACPVVADWNNDGKKDLIVGALDGKLRVYLNEGTDTSPDFRAVTIVQDQDTGLDLAVPSGRSSPVIEDFDDDGRKDVLTGNTDGQLILYSNVGTDAAPLLAGSSAVYVESDGTAIDLDGTPRSRPSTCDWTGDGRTDVLIGSLDGLVRLYQGVAPPTPPSLVAAASRKTHAVAGDLDIDLPLDGAGVECRCFGDLRIVLVFDEPVLIDCANVMIPGAAECGMVTDLGAGAYEVLVTGAPDETCLSITLVGVTDLDGVALTGDNDVQAVLLCGDTTADGVVDSDDLNPIIIFDGQAVLPNTARYDLDGNGYINLLDRAVVNAHLGAAATCDADPAVLVAAASRRAHPNVGDLDIPLPLDPPSAAGIECRRDGVQRMVLTFSEPVQLACENVLLSSGSSCTGVTDLGDSVYEVGVSGAPDQSCLVMTLIGVIDMDTVPLVGDKDVHVIVLAGDTNQDRTANLADMAQAKLMNGTPLDESTARYDINVDGVLNLADMALAKLLNGARADCP